MNNKKILSFTALICSMAFPPASFATPAVEVAAYLLDKPAVAWQPRPQWYAVNVVYKGEGLNCLINKDQYYAASPGETVVVKVAELPSGERRCVHY